MAFDKLYPSSVKTVPNLVRLLGHLMKLKSIAESSEGQELLFHEQAIPVLSRLLKGQVVGVKKGALDVLNALTIEEGTSSLSVERRTQILMAVAENASGGLIELLRAEHSVIVLAGQTLINMLKDEDVRKSLIELSCGGIVTAFYTSFAAADDDTDGEPHWASHATKSLCVRGVQLLHGSTITTTSGLPHEEGMAAALLQLVRQGRSQQCREESLTAICRLVKDGGRNVCRFLHGCKAIPDFISLVLYEERGEFTESGLAILNEMASVEALSVLREVVGLLLPGLIEASHPGSSRRAERVNEATTLLKTCITFLEDAKLNNSLSFSVNDLRCLLSILKDKSLSCVSSSNVVFSLEKVLSCEDGTTLKKAFLRGRGVSWLATLLENAHSAQLVKEGVAEICCVISACYQDFIKQGGLQLLYRLLRDDSLECGCKVAKAVVRLLNGPGSRLATLDEFPYPNMMRLLRAPACQEFAKELLVVYAETKTNTPDSLINVEGEVVEELIRVVRYRGNNVLRKQAATSLLKIAERDVATALLLADWYRLSILVGFWEELQKDGTSCIVRLQVISREWASRSPEEWPHKIFVKSPSLDTTTGSCSRLFCIVGGETHRSNSANPAAVEVSAGSPQQQVLTGGKKSADADLFGFTLSPFEDNISADTVRKIMLRLHPGTAGFGQALDDLRRLAEQPEGQELLYLEQAIPVISGLLQGSIPCGKQKVMEVLIALTRAKSEDLRANILREVAENAWSGLIKLLQTNHSEKMLAGQALINIVDDEDVRYNIASHSGLVTALYDSFVGGECLRDVRELKSLCVRVMNLLSGSTAATRIKVTDEDMAAALVRLVIQKPSQQVCEESLLAIRNLVQHGGEHICKFLHARNAIPEFVSLISYARRTQHVLVILNEMATIGEILEAIVEQNVVSLLLPVLTQASHMAGSPNADRLNEATSLFMKCMAVWKDAGVDISTSFAVRDLRCVLSILKDGSLTSVSCANIISALNEVCLCEEHRSSFQKAFVTDRGVSCLAALLRNGHSTKSVKERIARLCYTIFSIRHGHREIVKQGGLQLVVDLFSDESLDCRYDIAESVLSLLAGPGSMATLDRDVTELLLAIVRVNLNGLLRRKAADVLLKFASGDLRTAQLIAGCGGLSVLVEFWRSQGSHGRDPIVRLLVIFCNASDNCKRAVVSARYCPLVLDYLRESLHGGSESSDLAAALAGLVQYEPARKVVVRERFYSAVLECIRLSADSQSSVDLLRVLAMVVEKEAGEATVKALNGWTAIESILRASIIPAKIIAIRVLLKLLDEDLALAGETILSLCVMLLGSRNNESPDIVSILEVLKISSKKFASKVTIVHSGAISFLIKRLSAEFPPQQQEVALEILLNLSTECEGQNVRDALVNKQLWDFLLDILKENPGSFSDRAAEMAICLLRNLSLASLASSRAIVWRAEESVVEMLIGRVAYHLGAIEAGLDSGTSFNVVRAAMAALEVFLNTKNGRMVLISHDGIHNILQVLDHTAREVDDLSVCIRLLNKLAVGAAVGAGVGAGVGDERKEACRAISDARNPDVITCLKGILELDDSSHLEDEVFKKVLKGTRELLGNLLNYGRRKQVRKRILAEGVNYRLADSRNAILCYRGSRADAL